MKGEGGLELHIRILKNDFFKNHSSPIFFTETKCKRNVVKKIVWKLCPLSRGLWGVYPEVLRADAQKSPFFPILCRPFWRKVSKTVKNA